MTLFRYIFTAFITTTPLLTFAAEGSLQGLLSGIIKLINSTLIPFLFGIAFLAFVINVVRYFILGADNKDAQEKAKSVALYSIAAFVFLVIFWGIVNMLTSSTGLDNCSQIKSDYVEKSGTNPYESDCNQGTPFNALP